MGANRVRRVVPLCGTLPFVDEDSMPKFCRNCGKRLVRTEKPRGTFLLCCHNEDCSAGGHCHWVVEKRTA